MKLMGALLATATALALLGGCGQPEPVQYPPGQRPCNEALAALGAVTQAQLDAGPGPSDPDGDVRDALEHAQEVLAWRAGESEHYSAPTYDALAATVSDMARNLIDAYEREDQDTPYAEATDYYDRAADFDAAQGRLSDECNGRGPAVTTSPSLAGELARGAPGESDDERFLRLLDVRGVPYVGSNPAAEASIVCATFAADLDATWAEVASLAPFGDEQQRRWWTQTSVEVYCPQFGPR